MNISRNKHRKSSQVTSKADARLKLKLASNTSIATLHRRFYPLPAVIPDPTSTVTKQQRVTDLPV